MLFLIVRQSNDRLSTLEKQKEKDEFTNTTPTGFQPKSLFQTPTPTPPLPHRGKIPQTPQTPAMPKTPATPSTPRTPASRMSDVESIESNTTATPDMEKMTLGRGRGRPRKIQQPPNMEDFPVDGTDQEKTKYIKKKTSEMYRFKKLTGTEEERKAYRARENARVKEYQQRKKMQTSQEETSSDSSNSRKKEQDRLRYVPYVKYVKHTLTNFLNNKKTGCMQKNIQ